MYFKRNLSPRITRLTLQFALALVNDPGGKLWQEPKYEDSLRLRLDHSYEIFLDILKTMIVTLRAMATKLGMDASGEVGPIYRHFRLLSHASDHLGPPLLFRTRNEET